MRVGAHSTHARARTHANARAHARQVFSPDFLTLFEATAYLLDDDPTRWSAQRSTALRSTAQHCAAQYAALPCTALELSGIPAWPTGTVRPGQG